MKRITVIVLLSLLVCGSALAAGPGGYTRAKVVSVHDVDTFTVLVDGFATAQRVRVADIDGPERRSESRGRLRWPDQPWALEATAWAQSVLKGQEVWLWILEPDRYGRLVCRVHLAGDLDYALEALRLGQAHTYTSFRKVAAYQAMEDHARGHGVGLWSLPGPLSPAKWRRGAWKE